MTLQQVRDLLLTITPNCYHYNAWAQPNQYLVWAEDNQSNAIYADDKMQIQATEGTLDLFTKDEYDPLFQKCQVTMNNCEDMTWRLNSTQREADTGYLHHEWVWEVENSIG